MTNEQVGRIFRVQPEVDRGDIAHPPRPVDRILVVDSVIGSRFALVQALALPGVVVACAADGIEAARQLAAAPVSLVIVARDLLAGSGVALLESIRAKHPDVARALIVPGGEAGSVRRVLREADLAFVLVEPWSVEPLRRTVSEVLRRRPPAVRWTRGIRRPELAASSGFRPRRDRGGSGLDCAVLVRGLLSGLNACETERQLVALVHSELARAFGVRRWLWVDEDHGDAIRIADRRMLETVAAVAELDASDRGAYEAGRATRRPARIGDGASASNGSCDDVAIAFGVHHRGRRIFTSVVWADVERADGLERILVDLQDGLRNACRRIRDAEARAGAARRLALRVSAELRMPMGALVHAIDRLRSEAERAGLPAEWVERVSCESRRVIEAMEHLEGEMLSGRSSQSASR